MKVFAINLAHQLNKKQHILNECAKAGLPVEIYAAVNGKNITEDELQEVVYDHPHCRLTRGEIGCALSHQYIYQKIISESIPIALILEDDSVFIENKDKITTVVNEIARLDKLQKKPRIYLLSQAISIARKQKLKETALDIYRTYSSYPAHSYIINLAAAKKLSQALFPVKFEADAWGVFDRLGLVKVYSVLPHLTITNDENWQHSSIHKERSLLTKDDISKRNDIIKLYRFFTIKRFFWRIFIKPFLGIEKLK